MLEETRRGVWLVQKEKRKRNIYIRYFQTIIVQNFPPFAKSHPLRPPTSHLPPRRLAHRPKPFFSQLSLSLSRTQQNGPSASPDNRPTPTPSLSKLSLSLSLGPSRPTAHEHWGSPSRSDKKLRQSRAFSG
jgi:hypothetical protein